MTAVQSPAPDRLLAVWEAGLHRHPLDRALLLFSLAEPSRAADTLADVPLGVRNASLLGWWRTRSGDRFDARLDCSNCGERLDLALDAAQLPAAATPPAQITVDGLRFKPLTTRHLSQVAGLESEDEAAAVLLSTSAETPDALPQDPDARRALLDTVGAALDAADPWADPRLVVVCPECGHEEAVAFDIASWLWAELTVDAQRLLDEVHALAAAYGWSERAILQLSQTRRSAYLERLFA